MTPSDVFCSNWDGHSQKGACIDMLNLDLSKWIYTLIWCDISQMIQMTPLVDWTITNINLAAHGRMEAMSAVVVTSMAASTFNTQLESWEPLIEPFEGIFK